MNIKKFLEFCRREDFTEFDMVDATNLKNGHLLNLDRLIQKIKDEKSVFENKYYKLKQRIINLNMSRISEIKKDNPRDKGITTEDQSKYKDMYTKYLNLKDEMKKFIEIEIKIFDRKYIDLSNIRYFDSHKENEIDSDSDSDANDIKIIDPNHNTFLNELKQKFPNHSEIFLKNAIKDIHISKEVFIKKENFRKYENKNKIMLKITLDSFKIEESRKISQYNIQSNSDFVSIIFSEFSEKFKLFFEIYAIQENNSAYILKIGGKLKDGVRVFECYHTLNEIILKNNYTLQGSLYIYRMLEQIFIDMNHTLPENLSQEEFYKINSNISDLYDVRDYFNTIRNSI